MSDVSESYLITKKEKSSTDRLFQCECSAVAKTKTVLLLTVVGVQVDLSVWVDLHSCSLWQLGNSAFDLGVNQQMVMLVNAFELLSNGRLLTALQESDLRLPRELAACVQTNMKHRPNETFCT